MKTTLFGSVAAALLVGLFVSSVAAGQIAVTQTPAHVMETLSAAKWGPAPPMLPPGAQIAVLEGSPANAAPYTVRLKFPANYEIPAHTHPGDEHVSVVSGELFMGMGKKLDRKTGMALGVGGFVLMPANTNHFAYTKIETTILLYGVGPVGFTYVNPADDPRTKTLTNRTWIEGAGRTLMELGLGIRDQGLKN